MKVDKILEAYKRVILNESRMVDEIGKFWVVTKPTKYSELVDIFFKTDLFGFVLQMKGGLKENEIVGVYKNEGKAKKEAERLLSEVK
jgi:hypothetical protein